MNRATQIMQLELRIPVSDAAHAIREARERAGRHGDASNHTDGSLIILTQSMNSRGSRSESSVTKSEIQRHTLLLPRNAFLQHEVIGDGDAIHRRSKRQFEQALERWSEFSRRLGLRSSTRCLMKW